MPRLHCTQVKDVDWDAGLGANSLDTMLAEHFVRVFAEKHKLDPAVILGNPRSISKMKKQVCQWVGLDYGKKQVWKGVGQA